MARVLLPDGEIRRAWAPGSCLAPLALLHGRDRHRLGRMMGLLARNEPWASRSACDGKDGGGPPVRTTRRLGRGGGLRAPRRRHQWIHGGAADDKASIRFVQVRHEEGAAFMACGYAKFTGRLGVCLATQRPRRDPPAQRALRRQDGWRPRCSPSPARPTTTCSVCVTSRRSTCSGLFEDVKRLQSAGDGSSACGGAGRRRLPSGAGVQGRGAHHLLQRLAREDRREALGHEPAGADVERRGRPRSSSRRKNR